MSSSSKNTNKPAPVQADFGLRQYLDESKELFTSMILVLPLFVLYQVGVLMADGVRNGVDFVTSAMWAVSGADKMVYIGINAAILAAFCVAIFAMRHRGTFRPRIWPFLIVESTVYASLFGGVVLQVMAWLGLGSLLASGAGGADYGIIQKLVLSLGAGLYEELVFRLIGMGGMFWLLKRFATDLPHWVSAIISVVVSSVVFSAIHHIGALGDPFTLGVFLFRFFAGALLAVIYWTRGFAVAVYTHAIYDIIVMLGR